MSLLSIILLSVMLAVSGQLAMKTGSKAIESVSIKISTLPELTVKMLSNIWVLSGLCLYGMSSYLWLLALSRAPLSFVYPFTALTLVVVMLASRVILGEAISTVRFAGISLICAGIILAARGSH